MGPDISAPGAKAQALSSACNPSVPVRALHVPLTTRRGCWYAAVVGTVPSKSIETFSNPNPERDYLIEMECPEFTCLCPKTGQPDFATIWVRYIPDKTCIELKSLKLYLWSYRNEGAFHEAVTNRILSDLVSAIAPRWMEIRGNFGVRGGIATTVTATHGKRDT